MSEVCVDHQSETGVWVTCYLLDWVDIACMGLHDAVVRAGWTQPLGYIVICLQHVQWSGLGKHGCLWTHIEFSALLVWGQGCIGQGT